MKSSRRLFFADWRSAAKSFRACCELCAVIVWLCAASLYAERLPIKNYTVSDGLAHNLVRRIFQDAKGFLWLATGEGLSRFDGYGFTNYSRADGLPHDFVNDIAADRAGQMWVATNGGGVARLIDEPAEIQNGNQSKSERRRKFAAFAIAAGGENNFANWVNRILFDRENRLWCVTDAGLFRAKNLTAADGDFELIAAGMQPSVDNAALLDSGGRLWFSVKNRVLQIVDGQRLDFEFADDVSHVIETRGGVILAESATGIFEFDERGKTWRDIKIRRDERQTFQTILEAADGEWWIGTTTGLIRYGGGRQTLYGRESGLVGAAITDLFIDRENNLWVATLIGLSKLTDTCVVSYLLGDANPPNAQRIAADRAGKIYAQIDCSPQRLAEIGEQTMTIVPNSETGGDCRKNKFFQDRAGRFWFDTPQGLKISDAPELDFSTGQTITLADGKPAIYQNFAEDSTGKIWLTSGSNLYAAATRAGELPHFELSARAAVNYEFILPDSSGNVWLAERSHLARWRNGKIEEINRIENLPAIQPRSLFQDSSGRVWIGTRYDGAIYTDDPAADVPTFQKITVADGLTSNTVWTIAEDDARGIYFGTGRGVDRFDRATGKMRHLSVDDGVIGSIINHLFKDANGNIWVAAPESISRIAPAALRENRLPPPVFITRVLLAGEELPLAETGVSAFVAPDLAANQNNVAVRFVGLNFQTDHALRYEYRLEGVSADWRDAGEQREVNYANLASGSYRFEVRAVNTAGVASENPATFEFQIPRPVWQRWWFATPAALLGVLLGFALYRYRVARLLETERMRTRIAADLHDDIGANLTKISILSEVAHQKLGGANNFDDGGTLLENIAETSRESVSAMSDIVWAINPKKDSLSDLTRRMRRYAEEILEQREISLEFDASVADLRLDANVRRNVYLIFKEAVSNIARHSRATAVRADFRIEHNTLVLIVEDDGAGFDQNAEYDGNGLASMRKRAAELNGNLTINSPPRGTKIILRVELARAFWS